MLAGERIDDARVDGLLSSKEVRGYVASVPMKHENVVSYVCPATPAPIPS